MTAVRTDREVTMIERGRVFRAELSFPGILTTADYKISIVTGSSEVLVFNRTYSSTQPVLTVGLYELASTGGSSARVRNRRLSTADAPPATVLVGVTATLNTVINQAVILASSPTGNAAGQFVGAASGIILKANTSYVVNFNNGGLSTADIYALLDLRSMNTVYTANESP